MAWHRSREKRLKQGKKRRGLNTGNKRRIKDLGKKVLALIKEKKSTEAKELLKQISATYQSSAKKGVIHSNNASRHISRLTKKINALTTAA